MRDIRYDLSKLFELAFGIKNPVFLPFPISIGRKPAVGGFPSIEIEEEENQETGINGLGMPVAFPMFLQGKKYKTFSEMGEIIEMDLADFQIPSACLATFSRAKNIITTQVSGAQGSVKELYGFEDWQIRLQGFCLKDNSRESEKTASQQKAALLNFERVCESIGISGSLFAEKNIRSISIEDIHFKQVERMPHLMPFEIRCKSDNPLELLLP